MKIQCIKKTEKNRKQNRRRNCRSIEAFYTQELFSFLGLRDPLRKQPEITDLLQTQTSEQFRTLHKLLALTRAVATAVAAAAAAAAATAGAYHVVIIW
ncbi:hypothetical protein PoB_000950700 [Plakobranchus ocellatus]|uniref:Uncharacterized protein n=1 Tax=Plakobranchus ocellatus TaxID=259542 RepID=A0AAV3YLI2_9GAST|nr:hypothetical protein PoB_000950700 [Plakobranchus ocellatus]